MINLNFFVWARVSEGCWWSFENPYETGSSILHVQLFGTTFADRMARGCKTFRLAEPCSMICGVEFDLNYDFESGKNAFETH